MFPGHKRKIVSIIEIPDILYPDLVASAYKPKRILEILDLATESIKNNGDAITFLNATITRNRERFAPLEIRFDGLEYEGAIFKNFRHLEKKNVFELKLPNDGFFYKKTDDPDFTHLGQIDRTRKNSNAWVQMEEKAVGYVLPSVEKLVKLFGFESDDWTINFLYNSDILSMEIIVSTPLQDRELTITFEPMYPNDQQPTNLKNFKYSELRKKNLGIWK